MWHSFDHYLCAASLVQAFGALKAAKSILRSHVIIGKGGKLLAVENGISPGDSFAQAADFAAAHKQGSGSDSKGEAEEEAAGGKEGLGDEEAGKKEVGIDDAEGEENEQQKAAPKKGKGKGRGKKQ